MGVGTIEGTLGRISLRMAGTLEAGEVLWEITHGLVDDLDAALARIWLVGPGDLCNECVQAPRCADETACLHLAASAGLSERLDGTYRRIPLGALKIGWIAETGEAVCTNDVLTDPRIVDKEWVRKEGIRSFAGYPLDFRSEVLGVVAMFARRTLLEADFERLGVFAAQAAIALRNARLYRELQGRESKIRRLVEANIIGVLVSDLDGHVLEANEAFLKMVGFTRDDLDSGQIRWTELTPPEWQAASDRAVTQLRATGSADVFEKEYFRKDGSRVPVLVGAAGLDGDPKQAVVFVIDLRERKAVEEALSRAREELARVTRISTVGELAASIAHEINQPLTAIASYASAALNWLQSERANVERARDAVLRTMRETERVAEIVQRVRALVTKVPPRTELVPINVVIREVLELTRHEVQRNAISLSTSLSADDPLVLGDRIELQQVVLNLILNAVDALSLPDPFPRELSIISRSEVSDEVVVEVRDSGRGLQAETMGRIFDPFFTTKTDGMGMGLAISRSIVVAHHGRLWATPNQPRGVVFRFALPTVHSDA